MTEEKSTMLNIISALLHYGLMHCFLFLASYEESEENPLLLSFYHWGQSADVRCPEHQIV